MSSVVKGSNRKVLKQGYGNKGTYIIREGILYSFPVIKRDEDERSSENRRKHVTF